MASVGARNLGKSLAEDLARTAGIAASKPADRYPQLHRHSLPGQVLQTTSVVAVTRSRGLAAQRTRWLLLYMPNHSESVRFPVDAVQNHNVGVRKKGLRMARGRCHCPTSLKHSYTQLFGSVLHQNCG